MLIGRRGGCDTESRIPFQVVLRLVLPRSTLTSERGESLRRVINLLGWQQSAIDRRPPEETEFGARQLAVSERLQEFDQVGFLCRP